MKKFLAVILAALTLTAVFVGCGEKTETPSTGAEADQKATSDTATGSDWDYIAEKGELVIGITYFEPMNYMDENGELTGFETEFATSVCEKLGVKPVFQKIDWDSKEVELNAKTIDCIWNGLTITDDRMENMDISTPYMENKQVMVTKAENADKFTSAEALSGATVVAEKQSAGEEVAQSEDFFAQAEYISVDSQAKALLEVKSGTADIAVIDYVMSIGTLAEGSDYSDLTVVEGQEFSPEQYGIAFRKDSTKTLENVNGAIQELANEGTLAEIAEKYNLQDLLLVKAE